jgi:outer membrane protein assembly factor BamA
MWNWPAAKGLARTLSLFGLITSTFLVVPLFPARAQAPGTPGGEGKLAAIHVAGSKRYSSEQIATAFGLQIGQMIHREDMQAAADHLAELGPFAKVLYRFSSRQSDITIEIQVEDAAGLPVSFDNFPWFTDAELTQALKDSGILFDGTAPDHGTILDAMTQALTKVLAVRGVHAVVEHAVVNAPESDDKIQQFQIVGSSLNVSAVEFSDPLAMSDRNVRLRLSDIVGHPFSRYAVEMFDFEVVRPVYLAQGHLRVSFGPPNARFAGDPTKPLPNTVTVLVTVNPGPVFKFGGVTWSGNRLLAASELDAMAGLKAGDPADGLKIFAAWDRVRDAYGQRGFLDAKVTPEPGFEEVNGRVTYRVSLDEGPQYHMRDLVLTGLSLEGERRIRAAWKIGKGEVFNRVYFEEFVNKGAKEAFGDLPAHYDEIGRWLRTDPKTAVVDVLLDFR